MIHAYIKYFDFYAAASVFMTAVIGSFLLRREEVSYDVKPADLVFNDLVNYDLVCHA